MICNKIKIQTALFISALILASATFVYAHAAVLWCYVENNRVYVEAFFMGGKKVQNGKIIVIDAQEKKIFEGTTNEEGLLDFEPPIQDNMKILLQLDTGHGSEFELTKQDFLDAAAAAGGAGATGK
ncbi:MAG: hypothetical protein OEV64_08360 [Desulfobulbaceae bacterium]|nr:hypothetical protein [Desulfobulbaceae bacterium]